MFEDTSSVNDFYDEPGDEQLDSILANVHNEILAHVHATSDRTSALLKIMAFEDGQMASEASARPSTSAMVAERLGTIVNVRRRALEMHKKLLKIVSRAHLLACDLDRNLSYSGDHAIGVKVAHVIARHHDRRLLHFLVEAHNLAVEITYDLMRIRRLDYEVTMNRDLEIIGVLSRELNHQQIVAGFDELDRALTRDRQFTIDQQIKEAGELLIYLDRARRLSENRMHEKGLNYEEARKIARDIELALEGFRSTSFEILHLLNMLEVDVCSVDVSDLPELRIADPIILIGVIWTADTVWPSNMRTRITKLSDELSPGIYKIRAHASQSMVHGRHAASKLQLASRLRPKDKRC